MPAAPAPAGAHTATTAAVGPAKIGVIAFQVAVGKTNEFQRNYADLQKKYDPKRQQLKTLSDEVENLTKQLQSQADKLSDAERASRAKTIDDKKKQLDRQTQDAQSDFQQEMQDLYSTTASKVYDSLSSYAQQHGYTLVLDIASQQSPIMYAVPTTDITQAVIDAYNTKSGVPAPPPAAPEPAAKPGAPAGPTH